MGKRITTILACCLCLAAQCLAQRPSGGGQSGWVDSLMCALTPDERLGQLLMVDVSSKWGPDDPSFQLIEKYIDSCYIGGVIFFYGGPMRQAALHNRLQARSKAPLMVGIDGEWGLSMRLDSVPVFPKNLTLGAVSDNRLIADLGREIGRECRRMGINIDFMPCVDLYTNLANPVIANRSFGSSKINVARKASCIMQGLQRMGVLATPKHFPGHGNTETDSHEALPIIRGPYRLIDTLDMFPFKYLSRNGMEAIMAGHLLVPAIVGPGDATPSSISPKAIQGVLRDTLNFAGLVFTDALQMKGVTSSYGPGELELKAFEAGVDVLLMPADCIKAFRRLAQARDEGRISQEEIDKRCRKILEAKYRMGLAGGRLVSLDNLEGDLNSRYSAKLYRRLAEKSVTLIKNDGGVLPLRDSADRRVAVVTINKEGYGNEFEATLCQHAQVDIYRVKKAARREELGRLIADLEPYGTVVLGIQDISSYPRSFGMSDALVEFIDALLSSKRVVLDIFSSPVGLTRLSNLGRAAAIVVSYEDGPVFWESSSLMLLGGLPFEGSLPVGIGPDFPQGLGLRAETRRLE